MEMPVNRFKQRLKAGEKLVGLWSQFGNGSGHRDRRRRRVRLDSHRHRARAARSGAVAGSTSHHRAVGLRLRSSGRPGTTLVLFKRLLDVGAQTLLVPYVESAEEAKRAVIAARYPPLGRRGVATTHRANRYGRVGEYYARATDETCVLVQLETTQAVAALDEIADVDGVDGVFIGPSDLAASMGYVGQPTHPEPRKLIRMPVPARRPSACPIGILAPVEADAQMFLETGFTFVAVGSEIGLLRKATDDLRAKFKN